jgi:hypothetical protein
MIRGYKPNGYTVKSDGVTRIEGETRQCVHCQFMWEYIPGSGTRRGFCTRCMGFVCNRSECHAEQARLLALFPDKSLTCIPFEDVNKRLLDTYDKDPRFAVTSEGHVILTDA